MSKSKTCATCRYWQDLSENEIWDYGAGDDRRLCRALSGFGLPDFDKDAFINDAEDYWAGLFTRPAFSCSLWQSASVPFTPNEWGDGTHWARHSGE